MKTRIIAASCNLFVRYGIRAVTIDMLSSEMGISKKTLYEHFSGKEEILTECLRQHFDQTGLFDTKSEGLIDELVTLYSRVRRVNLSDASNFCSELRRYYYKLYQELLGRIHYYAWACSQTTDRGIEEGYVRKDVCRDVVCTMISGYLAHFFTDTGFNGPESGGVLPPEAVVIFTRGLCTIKGRSYLDQKLKGISE